MKAPLLLASLLLVGLSGCLGFSLPTDAEVIVLDLRIIDLAPDQEPRGAEPGGHCGSARRDGDTIHLQLWPDEKVAGPWVVVFPEAPEHWNVHDDNPFSTRFPYKASPRIYDDDTGLGTIDRQGVGEQAVVTLDGHQVSLPHQWNVTADDGSWRTEATLYDWTGEVRYTRANAYCD